MPSIEVHVEQPRCDSSPDCFEALSVPVVALSNASPSPPIALVTQRDASMSHTVGFVAQREDARRPRGDGCCDPLYSRERTTIAASPNPTPMARRGVMLSPKSQGAASALSATPPPRTMVPVEATGPPRRSATNSKTLAKEMAKPLAAAKPIPARVVVSAAPRTPTTRLSAIPAAAVASRTRAPSRSSMRPEAARRSK